MEIDDIVKLLVQKNLPEYKRKHAEKQMKNKVRLRSLPPEKLHEVLNEKEMMEWIKSQRNIWEELNNPAELPSIDITLQIKRVMWEDEEDNNVLLLCDLGTDNNGNFERIQKAQHSKWSNDGLPLGSVRIIKLNSEKECWKIIDNGIFICNTGFKWTEIKKIIQRNKKDEYDPAIIRSTKNKRMRY